MNCNLYETSNKIKPNGLFCLFHIIKTHDNNNAIYKLIQKCFELVLNLYI